jgi:hypothetical protein
MAKRHGRPAYYRAVVCQIDSGPYGHYAVTHHSGLGSISFSLRPGVWKESQAPERGDYVILSDVKRNRGGWRALTARFEKPGDGIDCLHSKEQ